MTQSSTTSQAPWSTSRTHLRGRLEHLRYGRWTRSQEHGHLVYIGKRSAETLFGVLGLHHTRTRHGIEITIQRSHGDELVIGTQHGFSFGPLTVSCRPWGSMLELYVWVKRRPSRRWPHY